MEYKAITRMFKRWTTGNNYSVQLEYNTISKDNTRHVNDYDHFSFDERRFAATEILYERVESVSKYLGNDFEKHWKEVSDHVPIKIELNINSRG